ncbi:hypothetical protein ACS0TY_013992 [Phlomoides rotata]
MTSYNLIEQIFRFCRSKCHKNFKMKRNPRKVKWTKAYRRLHGKDMISQDATFEFERKRNRPERYDRNVTDNTLKAIKKIDKVRTDREVRHHQKRMVGKKGQLQREAAKELEQSRAFTWSKLPVLSNEIPHSQSQRLKCSYNKQRTIEWRSNWITLVYSFNHIFFRQGCTMLLLYDSYQ